MDEEIKNLEGSPIRDRWRRLHKDLSSGLYGADGDFIWVEFTYPGVVAYLDIKGPYDSLTRTEIVLYNYWINQAPVYIIQIPETIPIDVCLGSGIFKIGRYYRTELTNQPNPNVEWIETTSSWSEFEEWEVSVRNEYKQRNGWNGNLKQER